MEGPLTILVFIGVIFVTALIFSIWVVVSIVRTVFRAIMAIFGATRGPTSALHVHGRVCGNARCKAVNPGVARFCRRCGRELPESTRASVRRAAMM
jgi:hypothetical protein